MQLSSRNAQRVYFVYYPVLSSCELPECNLYTTLRLVASKVCKFRAGASYALKMQNEQTLRNSRAIKTRRQSQVFAGHGTDRRHVGAGDQLLNRSFEVCFVFYVMVCCRDRGNLLVKLPPLWIHPSKIIHKFTVLPMHRDSEARKLGVA